MALAEDIARVASASGLSRVELAALYGVSRQTLHYWLTEAPPREGSYLARMAIVITAALLKAIESRVLPLAVTSKEVRARRIASMAKTLTSLRPAPAA